MVDTCTSPDPALRTPPILKGRLTDLDCSVVRLDLGFGPRSLVMFLRFYQKGWK